MLLLNFDTPPASASQILGLEACLVNFSSLPSIFFLKNLYAVLRIELRALHIIDKLSTSGAAFLATVFLF